MKLPIDWLKEYVDVDIPTKELADKFSLSGSEVEYILKPERVKNVVIGEILEIKKHQNADKLHVCKIDVGEKSPRQIICGSMFVVKAGDKVPIALAPTTLPGGLKIKKSKIRGIESNGMIASNEELGLENDELMFFDKKTVNGADINKKVDQSPVLDLDITPNRQDTLSIIGLAREASVFLNKNLKPPSIKVKEGGKKLSDFLTVNVKEKNNCPRYMARAIQIKNNGSSPEWIKKRLIASGVQPISKVVDITNYVMLEWGEPLHAFDLEKLTGNKKNIVVRKAKKGEKIEMLDGKTRQLDDTMLVIADSKKPIAVAGIMGGEKSGMDSSSGTVVLEAAIFDYLSIRKTSRKLGVRTESSSRFEKGLPLRLPEFALDRAATMIAALCGGKILKGKIDTLEKKAKPIKINLRLDWLNQFIGQDIRESEVKRILSGLGFDLKDTRSNQIEVTVPWWRMDVSMEQGLAEEVARIYGYNNLKPTLPKGDLPQFEESKRYELMLKIKRLTSGLGFSEVYNYSFIDSKYLKAASIEHKDAYKIENPASPDQEYMKTSLIPHLLQNVARNQNQYKEVKIFEISNIYTKSGQKFPKETRYFSSALVGGQNLGIKYKKGKEFFAAKGVLENLFSSLGVSNVKYKKYDKKPFDGSKSAEITIDNKSVGVFGEIDDATRGRFGIKKKVAVFDIDLDRLLDITTGEKVYKSIPRFPGIVRDLSFAVDSEVEVGTVFKNVRESKAKYLKGQEITDIYLGKELGENKKSITVSLEFFSEEKTLEDKEVDSEIKKIIKNVERKTGGELRDDKRRE